MRTFYKKKDGEKQEAYSTNKKHCLVMRLKKKINKKTMWIHDRAIWLQTSNLEKPWNSNFNKSIKYQMMKSKKQNQSQKKKDSKEKITSKIMRIKFKK